MHEHTPHSTPTLHLSAKQKRLLPAVSAAGLRRAQKPASDQGANKPIEPIELIQTVATHPQTADRQRSRRTENLSQPLIHCETGVPKIQKPIPAVAKKEIPFSVIRAS